MYKVLLLITSLVMFNSAVWAGDVTAGKALSAKCLSCHGADGKSINATIPNLAGKEIAYIKERLTAYRDGSTANPLMNSMAASLSDADIDNLATYYNSLPM